jgi:hypothetical protein
MVAPARRIVALLVAIVAWSSSFVAAARAVEIEGVQPAALDQPRVNLCLRRDAKGKPLAAKGDQGLGKLLQGLGGVGAGDAGEAINIHAFLDTGASGILISRTTATALGIRPATSRDGKEVAFYDVGVGGGEAFGVSEPLYFALAANLGNGGPDNADGYGKPVGPVRAQIGKGGGLIEQMTGGLDVVGMPAMKGKVVVLNPKPVDTFGDTMRSDVLDPRADRGSIPKVDRHVQLSFASFERFTRTEPAGAPRPDLADNPFVGPSPVARGGDKNARGGAGQVPPIVVTHKGESVSGSWLLDTGAAASMISVEAAKKLGVTYVEGTEGTDRAKLSGVPDNEQFTFAIGGVGGQKTSAGFFLDTLTIPTRERDPIVYKRAPVLVTDITVEDPRTHQRVTLDGVLGMNYFVATANIKQAGLLPDINQLTVGAYEAIVFDQPGAVLGLKLKPEVLKSAAPNRGTIEVKPAKPRR